MEFAEEKRVEGVGCVAWDREKEQVSNGVGVDVDGEGGLVVGKKEEVAGVA